MKVLMILNHAPDYRESLLRELGNKIDLTVVAQPCNQGGLSEPEIRHGYKYVEIEPIRFFGLLWQPGLARLLREKEWSAVCVSANLRHVSRIILFMTNRRYRNRWIWWGLIFGEIESKLVSKVRKYLLKRSAICLVHSKAVSIRLKNELNIDSISYNNTEVMRDEFRSGFYEKIPHEIKMLFVGTYKPRKRLERLIQLSGRRKDVRIRIVGPGMEKLYIPEEMKNQKKVKIFGRATGNQLDPHFDWADLVVSPGNAGLLIMNAARHGKGIAIDNKSYHGPEIFLAEETDQPFISFGDNEEVDRFLDNIHENPSLLQKWGRALQSKAKKEYTVENMAEVHLKVFRSIGNMQNL